MKRTTATLLFFACLWAGLFAQKQPKHSRATIFLDGKSAAALASLGLECDHGDLSPGISITNDFSEMELAAARAAGFRVSVEIDDVADFYSKQNKTGAAKLRGIGTCPDFDALWPTPQHWAHGSMGGYFTLDEMEQVIDAMQAAYPDLISTRKDCSATISTWDGRKLQWVRISDNPESDEPEPEVLYTALHHAREPMGLSQMLMFMWHVLENYSADPEMKALVDNTELYFIPCVNPDGYDFNHQNFPDGGGMWRKNRRNSGNGNMGVDLNRNYGHQWGFDDTGSSPNPSSDVYRGPAGFSEPETQTVRDFCLAHEFKIALNYHTSGNLLIHPWGWADMATPTADSVKFRRLARWMTHESRFNPGLASQTVGYQVNGTSDDWQFAGAGIYAFTPEVGRINGFWPPEDEIDELAKSNLFANLTAARFVLNAAHFEDKTDSHLPNKLAGQLDFALHNLGLEPAGFTVSIEAVSANLQSVGAAQGINFDQNERVAGNFAYQLKPSVQPGDKAVFKIKVAGSGAFSHEFTLEKTYGGKRKTLLADAADNFSNWDSSAGTWGLNTLDYHSAPTSIGDSPDADYDNPNGLNFMNSNATVALPAGAVEARLRFWAKWEIATRYNYAQVYANGLPLCGKYTSFGGLQDNFAQPIYDGFQLDWVEEEMDLTPFLGQDVLFTFLMNSGGWAGFDGFNFDDLRVEVIEKDNSVSTLALGEEAFKTSAQPNPARVSTTIFFEKKERIEDCNLLVFNQLGQLFQKTALPEPASGKLDIDLTGWPPGVYFYQIKSGRSASQPQRLAVGQ